MAEQSRLDEAKRKIDKLAQELVGDSRPKGKSIIELRKLCGHHRTVPTSYELDGVTKEGEIPQRTTQVIEIWKGRYGGGLVALKVLRVLREEQVGETKSRFCKEVVLMKQLRHDNILPFYGVSTDVSDFCLVFPWYENGNIMDYLEKKPDVDRFKLLLDATNGLRFLHENRLVHGALRPSHILIDDKGVARLATAGRSSIVAVPDTSIATHIQSQGETDEGRYPAPEVQWPEAHGMDKILITKESDVYGMAMVAYEVLTGNIPYSGSSNSVALLKIQAGEMPRRPSNKIADQVWEFLEKCWSRDPTTRPSTVQVFDAFSQPPPLPRATDALGRRPTTEELPDKLKLRVHNIKFSLNKSTQRQFSIKFKYGNKTHMTSPTTKTAAGQHTWSNPETWLIETNKQHHGQPISFEVLHRRSTPVLKKLAKNKVCATGNFSLLNTVNKRIHVKLEAPKSTGPATLEISLMGI